MFEGVSFYSGHTIEQLKENIAQSFAELEEFLRDLEDPEDLDTAEEQSGLMVLSNIVQLMEGPIDEIASRTADTDMSDREIWIAAFDKAEDLASKGAFFKVSERAAQIHDTPMEWQVTANMAAMLYVLLMQQIRC